jgi:Alternative complex III, ActD subunit
MSAAGAEGAGQVTGLLASYEYLDNTVDAIEGLRKAGFEIVKAFAPYPEHHIEAALGYGQSPVRVFTLVGGLTGTATGFAFTTFTSMDWPLVVGGKPIVSIPAYVVIAFELTVLFGALATVIGLFINSRLPNVKPNERADEARRILQAQEPVELREGAEVAR